MDLKEIIDGLKVPQASVFFDRVSLVLLEKYLEEQGKKLWTPASFNKLGLTFDAICTEGIKDTRPAIVEVRFIPRLSGPVAPFLIRKIVEKFKPLSHQYSLYLIVPAKPTDEEIKKIVKAAILIDSNIDLHFFDITFLNDLFLKYAEYVQDIIPEASSIGLKNIVDKSVNQTDWKKDRDLNIEKLCAAIKNDDLVLFIGAGVSASAGLPDWNTLLSKLLVSLIGKNLPKSVSVNDKEKNLIATALQKLNLSSPLLEARYVNSGLGDDFEKEISKILYKNAVKSNSELIKAIATLCIPPRGGLGIRAIVNYNFDDLIEKSLADKNLRFKSIYRETEVPSNGELGIYHVHGFLPQNLESYEGISESLLVFSEKNYHTVMQEPYFWSNLIQLNFLRENVCLLVGISGNDPNLRRLFEIAKRKTRVSKHYLLLKRTSDDFFLKEFENGKLKTNKHLVDSINSIHHNLLERSYDELGLNIIWFEEYNEIPDILSRINLVK